MSRQPCAESRCLNYAARGYIICEGHLYGWPQELPPEHPKRKAVAKLESAIEADKGET